MSKAVAIIPARYAAQRLPGKPLLAETGTPLICHVLNQARKARSIESVIVATDDERIAEAVRQHGGDVCMTRQDHPNGTSRLAEVVQTLRHDVDVVVNVQGDEPELDPTLVDRLVERLRSGEEPMATLASEFEPDEDVSDPNIVKLIVDQRGRAMYFSRSVIPFDRDNAGFTPLKHPGVYAYRPSFLLAYVNLEPTPYEQLEKLEQLRALEHGYPIAVVKAVVRHHGIDTRPEYDAFVRRWQDGLVDG